MSDVDVKWLHAPGHAGSVISRVVKFACETEALVIDWSEMYWNIDDLLPAGKEYNHFWGDPRPKDVRGRTPNHDVVISTHKDAKVIHDEEFFLAKPVPVNIKYMPARWGKARVVEYRGKTIAIIAWHPQPNPLRWLGLVLPGYRKSVSKVEQVQKRLERDYGPDLILNGGDLQLRPGKKSFYPNKLADRLRMRPTRHKIDWMMHKGKFVRRVDFKMLNPARVNSKMDHMWMLLTLKIIDLPKK